MGFEPVKIHKKGSTAKPAQKKKSSSGGGHWYSGIEHFIGDAANTLSHSSILPETDLISHVEKGLFGQSFIPNPSFSDLRAIPNFGKDAAHAVPGMGVGLYHLAGDTVHDTGNIFESIIHSTPGSSMPYAPHYRLGKDLSTSANSMLHQWRYVYGPATRGDFHTTAMRIEDHPLGPVLDVLSVLSLGGGLLAKGGKALAVAGDGTRLGEAGAKVAGLEKVGVKPGETPGTMRIKASVAETAKKRLLGAEIKGNDSQVLLPKERVLQGRSSSYKLGSYSQNPATRSMEMAGDSIASALPGWRGIGADARIGRLRAQNLLRKEHDATYEADSSHAVKSIQGTRVLGKQVGGIKDALEQRIAEVELANAAEGRVAGSEAARLDKAASDLKKTDIAAPGVKAAASIAERFKNSPPLKAARLDAVTKAQALTGSEDALIAGRASKTIANQPLVKGGLEPRGREALIQRAAAQDLARAKDMRASVAKNPEKLAAIDQRISTLRKISGGGTLAKDRLENSAIAHSGQADSVAALSERAQARANIQRAVQWSQAAGTGHPISDALEAFRKTEKSTTGAYKEGGIQVGNPLETSAYMSGERGGDILGKKGRFVFPQSQELSTAARKAETSGTRQVGKNLPRPTNARHRTGYAIQHGIDAANPKMVPWANHVAHRWLRSVNTFKSIVDASKTEGELNGRTAGWLKLPDTQLDKFLEIARSAIDDELPVAFGDSPQLEQSRQVIQDLIERKSEGGPIYVPRKFYKRMMDEITPRSRHSIIDVPTAAWRTFLVTAIRPAFLTYDFIGQTIQLLLAHGVLNTMRTMIAAASPEARAAMLDAERSGAGSLRGVGISTVGRETGTMLKNPGDGAWARFSQHTLSHVGDFTQYLSNMSAALTDDPFRRMAFQNELRPFADRLLKERRKASPEYTFGDAMRELVKDPEVRDRVQRKVLDDLVDFNNMSKAERDHIRRYINPFWGWVKGSSRMTAMLIKRRPVLSAGLYHEGEIGRAQNEKTFGGKVNDFYGGLIPLNKKGTRVLSPYSVNPFQTPVDLIQQLQSPFSSTEAGPDNVFAATNPVVKALLAMQPGAMDQFSGRPIPGKTPLDRAAYTFFTGFPQIAALQNIDQSHSKYNAKSVMPKSAKDELFKYFGIPVRSFNPKKAVALTKNPPKSGNFNLYTNADGKNFAFDQDGNAYMELQKSGSSTRHRARRRRRRHA